MRESLERLTAITARLADLQAVELSYLTAQIRRARHLLVSGDGDGCRERLETLLEELDGTGLQTMPLAVWCDNCGRRLDGSRRAWDARPIASGRCQDCQDCHCGDTAE